MGDQFEWINKQYGLSLSKGVMCTYTGCKRNGPERGKVMGVDGSHVRIRIGKHIRNYHPTWEMAYDGKAGA